VYEINPQMALTEGSVEAGTMREFGGTTKASPMPMVSMGLDNRDETDLQM